MWGKQHPGWSSLAQRRLFLYSLWRDSLTTCLASMPDSSVPVLRVSYKPSWKRIYLHRDGKEEHWGIINILHGAFSLQGFCGPRKMYQTDFDPQKHGPNPIQRSGSTIHRIKHVTTKQKEDCYETAEDQNYHSCRTITPWKTLSIRQNI